MLLRSVVFGNVHCMAGAGHDASLAEKNMKQKIGTLLDETVFRRAKRRAVDEGRPLSDVIQDALERYLATGLAEPAKREAAYALLCERPIKLSRAQFKAVLEHDGWDL